MHKDQLTENKTKTTTVGWKKGNKTYDSGPVDWKEWKSQFFDAEKEGKQLP